MGKGYGAAAHVGLRERPIPVTCALSGDGKALHTSSREFASLSSVEEALLSAGVQEIDMLTQMQMLRSGFPTFIKVSNHIARTLDLLSENIEA